MNNTKNMCREFEVWFTLFYNCPPIRDGNAYEGEALGRWISWQAATERATAVTNAQIVQLRKDALRAATVAFSLMVIHSPDELPDDAQQLAEWLEINALHLLPVDDDAEVLFIDIIRQAIRQGGKV